VKWAGYVARMGETKCIKMKERDGLEVLSLDGENNIRIDHKDTEIERRMDSPDT